MNATNEENIRKNVSIRNNKEGMQPPPLPSLVSSSSLETIHTSIVTAAAMLRPRRSTLRNGVSSHTLSGSVSLASLEAFAIACCKIERVKAKNIFAGSLDGVIVLSIRLGFDQFNGVRRNKRAYDDAPERASAMAKPIRRRAEEEGAPPTELIDVAEGAIERLLRDVRGCDGEEIVETCALSMASVKTVTASATLSTQSSTASSVARPKLIIAARLAAGSPISLKTLRGALGSAFGDGLVTTDAESVSKDFKLPPTDLSRLLEAHGGKALLLFAAVGSR
jgi:hypothetical protein